MTGDNLTLPHCRHQHSRYVAGRRSPLFDDTNSSFPPLGITNVSPTVNPWTGATWSLSPTTDANTGDFAQGSIDGTFVPFTNTYGVSLSNITLTQVAGNTGFADLDVTFAIEFQLDALGLPVQPTLYPNFVVSGTVQNPAGSFAAISGQIDHHVLLHTRRNQLPAPVLPRRFHLIVVLAASTPSTFPSPPSLTRSPNRPLSHSLPWAAWRCCGGAGGGSKVESQRKTLPRGPQRVRPSRWDSGPVGAQTGGTHAAGETRVEELGNQPPKSDRLLVDFKGNFDREGVGADTVGRRGRQARQIMEKASDRAIHASVATCLADAGQGYPPIPRQSPGKRQ